MVGKLFGDLPAVREPADLLLQQLALLPHHVPAAPQEQGAQAVQGVPLVPLPHDLDLHDKVGLRGTSRYLSENHVFFCDRALTCTQLY